MVILADDQLVYWNKILIEKPFKSGLSNPSKRNPDH